MNKKVIISSIFLAALLICTCSFVYNNHVQAREAEREEMLRKENYAKADQAVMNLYNDDQCSISDGLTEEQVNDAEKLVNEVEDPQGELKSKLNDVRYMLDTKFAVEALTYNNILNDGVDERELDEVKTRIDNIKSKSSRLHDSLLKSFKVAQNQFNSISQATISLEHVEKNPTKELLKRSKSLIEQVKNPLIKTELAERLSKVDHLIEKEILATQKQIQELENKTHNTKNQVKDKVNNPHTTYLQKNQTASSNKSPDNSQQTKEVQNEKPIVKSKEENEQVDVIPPATTNKENEHSETLTDTKENSNGGEDHYWGWE
ncbi:hypothetical protein [Cytobacillus purgationiresistens]|uniref:ElaB/YqjD/DUF883 family membrane-anchored ribosome-binding protein n=1 Tax=Cytobacillus purgationiresistens TaxID=863449 RepID=A0ABU0AQF8_9BACI|nr:hypothetical protein [Cytobacillus purgationiresistens]MDQ0273508.1 ElaB/YqjD/DUF883 family membrane-anchored ribosome-binding protein [Cytobacillus purgationiresistens]